MHREGERTSKRGIIKKNPAEHLFALISIAHDERDKVLNRNTFKVTLNPRVEY